MRVFTLLSFCILFAVILHGQNVGIGTNVPSEKLEVAGKIFTNQGGIVFPDNSVQTTAAFNETPESVAMPRGIGFIEFSVLELFGPIDTLGLENVSLIYSSEMEIMSQGGIAMFGQLEVTKLNDKNSQRLLKYIGGQIPINEVQIYLTRETSMGHQIYYETTLKNVQVKMLSPSMLPGREGGFAHTDKIGFIFEEIIFHDLESNLCHCWNVIANQNCPCP